MDNFVNEVEDAFEKFISIQSKTIRRDGIGNTLNNILHMESLPTKFFSVCRSTSDLPYEKLKRAIQLCYNEFRIDGVFPLGGNLDEKEGCTASFFQKQVAKVQLEIFETAVPLVYDFKFLCSRGDYSKKYMMEHDNTHAWLTRSNIIIIDDIDRKAGTGWYDSFTDIVSNMNVSSSAKYGGEGVYYCSSGPYKRAAIYVRI